MESLRSHRNGGEIAVIRIIHPSKKYGMSMLEILVAYGILSIAVLALLGGLPAAARQQNSSIRMNTALYLAEAKMDDILDTGSRLATTVRSDNPLGDDSMVREWWGDSIEANTTLQMITVKVTWLEEGGRTRKIILRSYLPI